MSTWYKSEFPYRAKITLTNSGSLVEDDTYLVEIDTATLFSAGKCREDCDDIIFCKTDDPTILTRYILPGSENTATTSIYIRIPNLDAGDTEIYMYYGSLVLGNNQALAEYYKELKGSVEVTSSSGGYYRDIYKTVVENIDGSRTTFTVEDLGYLDDSLVVYLRGQQLLKDTDFWEATPASGVFEFATPPYVGDDIWAEYYDVTATPSATPQYWWSHFTADTGSVTTDQDSDTFDFNGGTDIETTISGKRVTIDYTGTSTDELAKVSANDTTAGYLNGKLVAGTGVSLTEGSDGGNETLTIASTITSGSWKTLYDYTVSGAAVSRYLMTVSEATHSAWILNVQVYNAHASSTAENYLYYNEDETDGKYYRQKYYYTAGAVSASQDNNAFVGGVIAGDTGVIRAKIDRPTGTNYVFTDSSNIARYTTANKYPRAYISNGIFDGAAALTKICLVCKTGGVGTALLYAGTRITLLGLKV